MNRPLEPSLGPYCGAPIPGGCDRLRGRGKLCQGHQKQKRRGKPFAPLLLPHGKFPGTRCVQCGRRRNLRGAYCGTCKSAFYRRKRKVLLALTGASA